MKTSHKGLLELASHEGIVPYPYKDSVGVWTFGIGHTAAAGDPDPVKMARGVPRPMADVMDLFAKDVIKYEKRVSNAVKVPLEQHEFDALVSFDFNTGRVNNCGIVRALNAGKRAEAIEAFNDWHKPPEVTARRNREQLLFRDGIYSSGGIATVYPADRNGKVLWNQGKRTDIDELLARTSMLNPPFALPPEPAVILPEKPVQPLPDVEPIDVALPAPRRSRALLWLAIAVLIALAVGGYFLFT